MLDINNLMEICSMEETLEGRYILDELNSLADHLNRYSNGAKIHRVAGIKGIVGWNITIVERMNRERAANMTFSDYKMVEPVKYSDLLKTIEESVSDLGYLV